MSEQQIYNYPLYISIIVVSTLEYLAILYLLIRNVNLRELSKKSTAEVVWKIKNLCLSFLCILHIFTIFNITWVLLKHVGAATSYEFCEVVNYLYLTNMVFARVFIWIVLYCRYRVMNDVLKSRSWLSRCSIVLTKTLVLGPLFVLPFSLATIESKWKTGDYDSCILVQRPTLDALVMWLMFATNVIFFGLFLWQMRMVLNMSKLVFDLDMLPNNRVNTLARVAALRNLIVTCCTCFWPLVFQFVIYIVKKTTDVSQPHMKQNITFLGSLVVLLNMLTNNIALYGVFRDWSFFLCPRRPEGIQEEPLLMHDTRHSRRIQLDQVGEDFTASVDIQ